MEDNEESKFGGKTYFNTTLKWAAFLCIPENSSTFEVKKTDYSVSMNEPRSNIFTGWMLCLISLLFCFPAYSKELNPTQTVYISSSWGDDRNDGSISSPKKTLSGLPENLRRNTRVLLKKGDVFYENLSRFDSCIITSYDSGEAPLICGFRKLKSNTHWEKESANVWKVDLFQEDHFSGYPMPAGDSKWLCNNIGFMYDETNDTLYGRLVRQKNLLEKRWDLFTSESNKPDQMFRFVYIFHEDPRSESGTFCFPVYEYGMTDLTHCHISHISVQGFSMHGISNLNDCLVENCAVDLIGGAIFPDKTLDWFRFGNGIEFWIEDEGSSANNNTVSHCWISRVYGCGASLQGTNASTNAVSNKFKSNVFYYCRHAFETLLEGVRGVDYIDCEFVGNICYNMTRNGFDCPEEWDANIYSDEKAVHKSRIKVYNNFFWGSDHIFMDSKFTALDMKFNVVFLYRGQFLNKFYGNYKAFRANTFLETNKYHEAFKSKDYVYIMNPEDTKNKSIQDYHVFLNVYFSQINIRHLPDFQGLDNSLQMLRYIAGQRESFEF